MVFTFSRELSGLEQWCSNFIMQLGWPGGFFKQNSWVSAWVCNWVWLGWGTSFQIPPKPVVKTTADTVTNHLHIAKSNG